MASFSHYDRHAYKLRALAIKESTIGSMGDDELAVLILSGWSDGPLPALEHSLR